MGRRNRRDGPVHAERAAQYVRKSTENQKYSTANQCKAIAEYADAHSLTIVRTYADEGKSGLTFEGRRALQQLIADVVSDTADFGTILVYDVSRWGRFQDNDESAYYEFICKKAGIEIRYCAEPFENDTSITSSLFKNMKRAMAAEYSRELSKKTFYGQSRVTRLGFHAGGSIAYALRRILVNANGTPIAQLEPGQQKALNSDRVILIASPPEEVRIVKTIFRQFVHGGKSPGEIAEMLNADHAPYPSGKPWSYNGVRRILLNEAYIGNNVYNRQSTKLKSRKKVSNPPGEWVRAIGAIKPPIVSVELFESAKRLIDEKRNLPTDVLLDRLRKLFAQKGELSARILKNSPGMPHAASYRRRFGGIRHAYRMIGYESPAVVIAEHGVATRAFLNPVMAQVANQVEDAGAASVIADPRHYVVVINEKTNISVAVGRCFQRSDCRELYWRAHVGRRTVTPDYAIVVRLDKANQSIADYYFLPPSELKKANGYWVLAKLNRAYLEAYRHKSLDFLTEFVANGCMMTDELETDRAVSERCKKLRVALDYSQSSSFAKFLEVSPQRWNNVEIGMPLSRDLAMTLTRKIAGLSLDWLYRGLSGGLSADLARLLGELSSSNIKRTTRQGRRP